MLSVRTQEIEDEGRSEKIACCSFVGEGGKRPPDTQGDDRCKESRLSSSSELVYSEIILGRCTRDVYGWMMLLLKNFNLLFPSK